MSTLSQGSRVADSVAEVGAWVLHQPAAQPFRFAHLLRGKVHAMGQDGAGSQRTELLQSFQRSVVSSTLGIANVHGILGKVHVKTRPQFKTKLSGFTHGVIRNGERRMESDQPSHERPVVFLDEATAFGKAAPRFVTSPSGFASRHTGRRTLAIVEMVYCGSVTKGLVGRLPARGGDGGGLAGVDGGGGGGTREGGVRGGGAG